MWIKNTRNTKIKRRSNRKDIEWLNENIDLTIFVNIRERKIIRGHKFGKVDWMLESI